MKACERCYEVKPLTHRIKSEILSLEVCYACGSDAEQVNARNGKQGAMRIQLVEPRATPTFFQCSLCGADCAGEAGYRRHFEDNHT
jgi:hypothetical protein